MTVQRWRQRAASSGLAHGVAYWRHHAGSHGPDHAPTVVVHGLGSDHAGLRVLTRALPERDTIELDLPGFGQSPPLAGRHTVTAYAHAVERLRRHLHLGAVNLVGHSLGADIALAHAAMYPDRVRALTLLHPVVAGTGPIAWLGRGYYRAGTLLPETLARLWLLSRPAVYLADTTVLATRDPVRRREILDDDYRSAAAASPRAISDAYLSLSSTPFHDLARRIAAPTLLVTGTRDPLARPRSLAALQALIDGSAAVVIDGAGHLWPVEEPHAAAALVAGNLR